MTEKLLQQAMALFDTQEKWDAFIELSNNKETICDRWRGALEEKIRQQFYSNPNMNKWQIRYDKNNRELRISPRQLSNKMEMRVNFGEIKGCLWIHKDIYNSDNARKMIQNNPNIMSLLDGFEYYSEWDIYNKPFANDICELSHDNSCYIWGHDTERVANEIFKTYLYPFMTDEIADFFVQVCNKTKKCEQ